MRAIRNANGSFSLEDDPIRVEGEDADALLNEMRKLDKDGPSEERKKFQEECERIFRASNAGRSE